MTRPALPLILALLPTALWAQDNTPSGVSFAYHDLELAFEITRTFRAAGYQGDDDDCPVLVRILARAGEGQPHGES